MKLRDREFRRLYARRLIRTVDAIVEAIALSVIGVCLVVFLAFWPGIVAILANPNPANPQQYGVLAGVANFVWFAIVALLIHVYAQVEKEYEERSESRTPGAGECA